MDRPGGTKQDAFVWTEVAAAEQSAHARKRRVRDRAALAHDAAVRGRDRLCACARARPDELERHRRRLERVADDEVHESDDLSFASLA